MENIFFMMVSFVCIVFLIDHLTKIMAHNKFKKIAKMKFRTKWYITFLFLIGTFLYLFIILNVFELFVLLGGSEGGSIPAFIMLTVGAILFIFVMKYSTYAENREKEKIEQTKKQA